MTRVQALERVRELERENAELRGALNEARRLKDVSSQHPFVLYPPIMIPGSPPATATPPAPWLGPVTTWCGTQPTHGLGSLHYQ